MRSSLCNSPQAATRILALAMLADGHQCSTELAALERLDAHKQLGLSLHEMQAVVHTFCEDLQAGSPGMCWAEICVMNPGPLMQVLDEVSDPVLQRKVLNLCIALVEADQHLTDSESMVLAAIAVRWKLDYSTHRSGFHGTDTTRYGALA